MAKVSWGLGKTINLGDFESLRIDMSFEDDVRPDETPEQAQARVCEFVDHHVGEMVKRAERKLKAKGNGGY